MALEVGSARDGTGLSGAIAAARKKAFPKTYNPARDPLVEKEAQAIIDYLVENIEVHVPAATATGAVDSGAVTVDPVSGVGALDSTDVTVEIEDRTGTIE